MNVIFSRKIVRHRKEMLMVRIQLEMPPGKVAELEQLMVATGLTTKKDLLNNALTLFEWAVKQKRAGRIIASVEEEANIYRELMMPALENVLKVKSS